MAYPVKPLPVKGKPPVKGKFPPKVAPKGKMPAPAVDLKDSMARRLQK